MYQSKQELVNAAPKARKLSLLARGKSALAKVATASSSLAFSAAALAQDMPATVDDAASFMTTKGLIAIGVAGAVTLIILGIVAAKLPRRGS